MCRGMTEHSPEHTPGRTFRLGSDLYAPAMRKARSQGRTLTSVIRELLRRYVSGDFDEDMQIKARDRESG